MAEIQTFVVDAKPAPVNLEQSTVKFGNQVIVVWHLKPYLCMGECHIGPIV
jgi:hypothetical protein